jgi:hypothetical protein
MSAYSKSWHAAGSLKSIQDSKKRANMKRWLIFMNPSMSLNIIASTLLLNNIFLKKVKTKKEGVHVSRRPKGEKQYFGEALGSSLLKH